MLVNSGDHVIDIGANAGWYTKVLSELVQMNGLVYSIEPIPPTFDTLTYYVKRKNTSNIIPLNYALGDFEGTVIMEVPIGDDGYSNFYRSRILSTYDNDINRNVFRVKLKPLDQIISNSKSKPITFIKCDVEGHEYSVVMGGKHTIELSMPALLIEISGNVNIKNTEPQQLLSYLTSIGYSAWFFDGVKLSKFSSTAKAINIFFLTNEHLEKLRQLSSTIISLT